MRNIIKPNHLNKTEPHKTETNIERIKTQRPRASGEVVITIEMPKESVNTVNKNTNIYKHKN